MTDNTLTQAAPAAQETPTTNPLTCSGCECCNYEPGNPAGPICGEPMPPAPAMIRLQAAQEAATEYRWEIKGIGQGHYHATLGSAYDAAHQASLQGAGQTVTIEQFRPERRHLITITNGKEI